MTDILLPPPLTESQVKALACAFIRGEAYIPTGFDDPRFTPLLRVVIRQVHDEMVAGKTEAEWETFISKVTLIVNPRIDTGVLIPPIGVKTILRSDEERVAKLIRPLMEFPGLESPREAGYG